MAGDELINILDRFTSIDDLLVTLLERIGGVTEEDTHFFSYPNDGTRATIATGTTTLDFMGGTVMTPSGLVSNIGNSLRARGREYCRSLSLQADRDIIIQIGTKSKIPVFAGTWFKVAHLRFTDVKIIAAESTRIFVIACTNPDSIEMAGETYVKDPVDVWGKTTTIGLGELAVRTRAPPLTFEKRGDVLRWIDFESATPNYDVALVGGATGARSTAACAHGDFSYKIGVDNGDTGAVDYRTNDFHLERMGGGAVFATADSNLKTDVIVSYHDGTGDGWAGVLRFNVSTGVLEYLNSANVYTTIDAVGYYQAITNFSTFKLVVDFASGKYVRALAFGNEYDLSQYTMRATGMVGEPHVLVRTLVTGTAAGVNTAYIDNMVLTENEPI